MNKCVTCKHCLYPEGNDKAYCGQRGDYINIQAVKDIRR